MFGFGQIRLYGCHHKLLNRLSVHGRLNADAPMKRLVHPRIEAHLPRPLLSRGSLSIWFFLLCHWFEYGDLLPKSSSEKVHKQTSINIFYGQPTKNNRQAG